MSFVSTTDLDTRLRFCEKVHENPDTGCWEWSHCRSTGGYGKFSRDGESQLAHRTAYELFVGPIPSGLQLDHLCRVRHCVNPDHLEPVTSAENLRRGNAPLISGAWLRAKTHCPHGHPYAGENLRVRKDGSRACRECGAQRGRRARRSTTEGASTCA